MSADCWIGIDLGTSGCRAIGINAQGDCLAEYHHPYPPSLLGTEQAPEALWQHTLFCLKQLSLQLHQHKIKAIAVDGTSGSVMLADQYGKPLSPILLYHDLRAVAEAEQLTHIAPADCPVHGATSGLSKLLWLNRHVLESNSAYLVHQADWITFRLSGELGVTDKNNTLKTGYDPILDSWPAWFETLHLNPTLPRVVESGQRIGSLDASLVDELNLSYAPEILAGTTDSTAAFIATGAKDIGDAVTVLGSTLVLKLLCAAPVVNVEHGIYSQPLGDHWLVGGASNTGGNVLRHFFTDVELQQLSSEITQSKPAPHYYPLLKAGERFPIADSELEPQLSPRPENDTDFLHGLLDSIARIEHQGYQLLCHVSETKLNRIITSGGGSQNPVWQSIRQQYFDVPVLIADHTEAAYGTALLARDGLRPYLR